MEKMTSFMINHLGLLPGIYASRKGNAGGVIITTFDIRMTRPSYKPVMNMAEVCTMEYLGATFPHNHKEFQDRVLYFGSIGCWTGFYLLLADDWASTDTVLLMMETLEFIRDHKGGVPDANTRDCGDYLDINLSMTKLLADHLLKQVLYGITEEHLIYPE